MCSPEVSFCISKTIVSDSSELNTVKQGREEWRSKCSKISVGRNRSRHNFFFSTNTKYVNRWNKKKHNFFVKCVWSFPLFFIIQLLTIENHFPRGLGCCLRDSLLFVCSVLKETRLHSQTVGGGRVESQTGLLDFNLQWCRSLQMMIGWTMKSDLAG